MRHNKKRLKFNRDKGHKDAMLRNLATSIILYEKVKTTKTKAKAIAPVVDHLIQISKEENKMNAIRKINKIVLDKNASKKLMEGIIFLYRQLGILPSVIKSRSKDHYLNNILIKSNHDKYDIIIGSVEQLKKAMDIWIEHKNADEVYNFIVNASHTIVQITQIKTK